MSKTLAPGVKVVYDAPKLSYATLNGRHYVRRDGVWLHYRNERRCGVTLSLTLDLGLNRHRGKA